MGTRLWNPSQRAMRRLLIARAVAGVLTTMVGVGVIIAGFVSHSPHAHLVEIMGFVYVLVVGSMARQQVRAVPWKRTTAAPENHNL